MILRRGLFYTSIFAAAQVLASCGNSQKSAHEEAESEQVKAVLAPADEIAVAPAGPANFAGANAAEGETAKADKEAGETQPANAASVAALPAKATPSAKEAPTVTAGLPPPSFAQCAVCHSYAKDAKPRIGPNLFGVYGSLAGTKPDFNYSKALAESGLRWSGESLGRFVEDPRGTVVGTKMIYPGMKDPAQRQEIVKFLGSLR